MSRSDLGLVKMSHASYPQPGITLSNHRFELLLSRLSDSSYPTTLCCCTSTTPRQWSKKLPHSDSSCGKPRTPLIGVGMVKIDAAQLGVTKVGRSIRTHVNPVGSYDQETGSCPSFVCFRISEPPVWLRLIASRLRSAEFHRSASPLVWTL